jgi:ATP-binding protein involved in chromosome partitioning
MTKKRLAATTYLVGSGKGGVGKSTLTVNLAVALSRAGLKTGLLDADVYGPSIPVMMGLRRLSPNLDETVSPPQVIPFTKFGVKVISLGFFIEEARPMIWRGPMLHSTLEKMICDVNWGELDVLLVDLPPGTGDVPLSLSQMLEVDAALVVTTPQEVAMLDAIKAINAFDHLNIPLMGVIENMSGFTLPGTEETVHIFGEGKGSELAGRFNTELLGQIPLDPSIRLGGDEGLPVAFHGGGSLAGKSFLDLGSRILEELGLLRR